MAFVVVRTADFKRRQKALPALSLVLIYYPFSDMFDALSFSSLGN